MKKNDVKIGGMYVAKVSDKLAHVRIDSAHSKGGWNATNTRTGKRIRIKSAQRLRGAVAGSGKKVEAAETTKADGGKDAKIKAPATTATKTAKSKKHDAKRLGTKKVATKNGNSTQAVTTKAGGQKRGAKKTTTKTVGSTKTVTKTTGAKKPKRVSALDAAAQVLAKAGKPMRAKELIAAMAEQNLWTSPGGKTPHATLYAAMLREIGAKGDAARFTKVDRGMFTFNKEVAA